MRKTGKSKSSLYCARENSSQTKVEAINLFMIKRTHLAFWFKLFHCRRWINFVISTVSIRISHLIGMRKLKNKNLRSRNLMQLVKVLNLPSSYLGTSNRHQISCLLKLLPSKGFDSKTHLVTVLSTRPGICAVSWLNLGMTCVKSNSRCSWSVA